MWQMFFLFETWIGLKRVDLEMKNLRKPVLTELCVPQIFNAQTQNWDCTCALSDGATNQNMVSKQVTLYSVIQGRTIALSFLPGGGKKKSARYSADNLFIPPPAKKKIPPWGKVITEGGKHLLPSFIMVWVSVTCESQINIRGLSDDIYLPPGST